jgi:hypothetical protein
MISKRKVPDPENIVTGQMNLIFRGRMLWRDMATWLTMYMFALYGGYPNQQAIAGQIYKLPLEYGSVMKLIFGDKVSNDYINLVSQYIIILEYLFYYQITGDQNAASSLTQQLYQNINQRAAFLAQINPYWQENTWKTLLTTFNNMLLEESTALLTKEYDKSVDIFNNLLTQSSIIGDYFSEGILQYLQSQATASTY